MNVLYAEHPTMFKTNPIGFIITLLLFPLGIALGIIVEVPIYKAVLSLGLVGAGVIILLTWYVKNKASKLVVTDTEIHFEEGLLSKSNAEINISSVRTVKVKQTFLDRIMGSGTIEVYTAGDTPEFVAKGMPDPHKIRDLT
ncbi:PH domain-containing protein [Solemya elarraichensis gill symbiont]|uniref:YdbS-like PH domain-containing protein n=1 Tax=Solemya elarraichensis gill symbiont TaxID=1918949 RepID=A0A1T2L3R7_9GAMM|nr:PH domain-containing protein [Solemya elarraichensis gill symbiont]OOZ39586.1 hypothetical protein BOW52_07090 [Solemya elarraichensis gill symbiont]